MWRMTNQNPLVSIIIPSLNQGQYIGFTIESILQQTYSPIEVIVVDGGSTDSTLDVLQRYNDVIKWFSEPDEGQVDAIEKGVNLSKGSIIAWLNSDDTYFPYAVERAVKAFYIYPGAGAVYADANFIDENGKFLAPYLSLPFDLNYQFYKPNPIPQPSTFMRRDSYLRVGRLNRKLHYVMDYELWFRLGLREGMQRISDVWSNYRWWADSKTTKDAPKFYEEILEVLAWVFEREQLDTQFLAERDRIFCAAHLHAIGAYAEYTDSSVDIERHTLAALKLYPECAKEPTWVHEMIAHVGPRKADSAFAEFLRIAIRDGIVEHKEAESSPNQTGIFMRSETPSDGANLLKTRIRRFLAPYMPQSLRELYRTQVEAFKLNDLIRDDMQIAWTSIRQLQYEFEQANARLKSTEASLYQRIDSLEKALRDQILWRGFEARSELNTALEKQDTALRSGITVSQQRLRNTFNRQLYGKDIGEVLSYSQYGEDTVAWKFFNKPTGFYVDVGAFDGVELSNTCLFEDAGWAGVCIEPNPTIFARLTRNRPGAQCYEVALASENGQAPMTVEPLHLYGGLEPDVKAIEQAYQILGQPWLGTQQITVQTRTLNSILESAGATEIDFVSIDVEGTEIDVLRGFDLARWQPKLLIMEANTRDHLVELKIYLQEKGYILAHSLQVNHYFVRAEDVERLRLAANNQLKQEMPSTVKSPEVGTWVLCCGMLRSGSTLQYNIAQEIVTRLDLGSGVTAFTSPNLLAELLKQYQSPPPGISVLKLHDYTTEVDLLRATGRTKGIYIYRDIRDVVVSWMRMQDQSFEEIDARNIVDTCLANYAMWTQMDGVLISRYETVMETGGLLKEVTRIAAHLGVDLEDKIAESISQMFSLEQQRERIHQYNYERDGIPIGRTIYNPKTSLHNNHINSGASGEWRDVLTPEQQELIIEWAGDWLKARGYL